VVLLNADPAALVTAHDDALELLASLMQRPACHAGAACQGKGWKMFFLQRGENGDDARKLYSTCAVRGRRSRRFRSPGHLGRLIA
jgi:hypothetical protein